MSKISLIVQREYFSRVRNRTFILTTLLTPLLFVLFFAGSVFLSLRGKEKQNIAVIDQNGFLKNNLHSDNEIAFSFPSDTDTSNYSQKGYTAIIIIPKFNGSQQTEYIIRSKKSLGIGAKSNIQEKINRAIEDNMLQSAGVERKALDSIHAASQFAEPISVEDRGNTTAESNAGLAYAIGYTSGILIYITMLIYGMMVLRGVMEEKTSRIAEVIVSSVKPFQLMLGKIIGIGAVGITQLIIWVVFIIVLTGIAQSFISHDTMQEIQTLQQNGGVMPGNSMVQASEQAQRIYSIQHTLGMANWPLIIICFIFYFIGGYLFYAALFAAVGSVIEDVQSSQSLTLPITMPIIFSFIIMTTTVNVPDSSLAVWTSIIPFSSSTVMMARIAYGVPNTVTYWQLICSMLLLIAGFLFTTWLAGKIYRTGLLMYGKKTTWKEMLKWAFRKN